MQKFHISKIFLLTAAAVIVISNLSVAVTTRIVRHRTAAELLKGETQNTIIDSEGTIKSARRSQQIDLQELLKDVWTINTIIVDPKGVVYLGTSPSGEIIEYQPKSQPIKDGNPDKRPWFWKKFGKHKAEPEQLSPRRASRIYPPDLPEEPNRIEVDPNDPNVVASEGQLLNEHVFAMGFDKAGHLLAGISGKDCRLVRFADGKAETIYEPNDAKYIFAIALDAEGGIYLGTGPEGKIYRLDSIGQNPSLIYDSKDKNILSLIVADGCIYAGSDERGLVYKISPTEDSDSKVTVLFDSEQEEITALLLDEDSNLYAAATSAHTGRSRGGLSSIAAGVSAGRVDTSSKPPPTNSKKNSHTTLKIANTDKEKTADKPGDTKKPPMAVMPKKASQLYKINPQGFTTGIFSEIAVFFSMVSQDGRLLIGTGNKARLFDIDPVTERKAVAYEDKQSQQITALLVAGDDVYMAMSNPPKLVKLYKSLSPRGTYVSDLIDAAQPARWGKLQIDAVIPAKCRVLLSARSGNVKDANDATFSPWSKAAEITEAMELDCPVGRFCQYKLTLESAAEQNTDGSLIREVAAAYVIANLPPRVLSIKLQRSKNKKKPGFVQISYKAVDDNADELVYKIEFRKIGDSASVDSASRGWIMLKDKIEKSSYEWDGKTVEDGRYELRVTADDRRSNTAKLIGSRISDPFVVDNTAPQIQNVAIQQNGQIVTLKLKIKDEFTAIGKVSYTVNSNTDWIAALPDDMVYDTTIEDFTIVIEDLKTGLHVIAVRISDDIGNTVYKTFEVRLPAEN